MQTDRAAGQARQFNAHRRAGLDGELEPLLLEDVSDKLLRLRPVGNRLRLDPIQVGRGGRAAIGKLGGTVSACGGRADPVRFGHASGDLLIKDGYAARVGCYRERAEICFSFAKEGRVTGVVCKHINRKVLPRI